MTMEEIKETQLEQASVCQCPSCQPKITTIAILLIAILLITGGVYAGIQIGKKQAAGGTLTKTTPTTVSQPTSIPTTIPAPDETTDWKTYKNEIYGFEFKYPDDFVYEYNGSEVNVKKDGKLKFQVKAWENYQQWQKEYLMFTSSVGEKTISGNLWKLYILPEGYCDMGGCTDPIFGLQTERNKILFSILFYGQSSESEFTKQILSTFKFLD